MTEYDIRNQVWELVSCHFGHKIWNKAIFCIDRLDVRPAVRTVIDPIRHAVTSNLIEEMNS
jgi:hypothetical protein